MTPFRRGGGRKDGQNDLPKSKALCGCGGIKWRYSKWCRACQKRDTLSRLACVVCGAKRSHDSQRCSKCRDAALRPLKRCLSCGTLITSADHARKRVYCSRACMAKAYSERMKASDNPNFRRAIQTFECHECGATIHAYTSRTFCSRICKSKNMRLKARKDANHDEIVEIFERLGCDVIDLSQQGRGIPDLFVKCRGEWHPVEIKNPKSSYGKAGLNELQKKFQAQTGDTLAVVRNADEVLALYEQWTSKVRSVEDALTEVQR